MLELDQASGCALVAEPQWFELNGICFIRCVVQQGNSWIDCGLDYDKYNFITHYRLYIASSSEDYI